MLMGKTHGLSCHMSVNGRDHYIFFSFKALLIPFNGFARKKYKERNKKYITTENNAFYISLFPYHHLHHE